MTPQDEFSLYLTDRHEWARITAPKRAAMLEAVADPKKKRAMWQAFGPESRSAISNLARIRGERGTRGSPNDPVRMDSHGYVPSRRYSSFGSANND